MQGKVFFRRDLRPSFAVGEGGAEAGVSGSAERTVDGSRGANAGEAGVVVVEGRAKGIGGGMENWLWIWGGSAGVALVGMDSVNVTGNCEINSFVEAGKSSICIE